MFDFDCWDCQVEYDETGIGYCEAHRPKVDRSVEVLPEPVGVDSKPQVPGELRRKTSLSHVRNAT